MFVKIGSQCSSIPSFERGSQIDLNESFVLDILLISATIYRWYRLPSAKREQQLPREESQPWLQLQPPMVHRRLFRTAHRLKPGQPGTSTVPVVVRRQLVRFLSTGTTINIVAQHACMYTKRSLRKTSMDYCEVDTPFTSHHTMFFLLFI